MSKFQSQNKTSEAESMDVNPPNVLARSRSDVSVTQHQHLPSQMVPPQQPMENSKGKSYDVKQLIQYFDSKSTPKCHGDEIDLLFMSYVATFKRFSSKKRAELKIDLANLFAKAELEEIEEKYSNTACFTRPN